MTRLNSIYDGVGIAGSLLCAIHCLVLPMLIPLVPLLGALAAESVHQWLVVALAAPALFAAWAGHRQHRQGALLVVFAGGVTLLVYAAWLAEGEQETTLTLAGGAILVTAHAINRYLCHRCPQCEQASTCGQHRADQ